MDYLEAIRLIHDRSDYDRGFISNPFAGDSAASIGLVRIRQTLIELGNPDHRFPIVHVAGTKGKGSTCAMIEAVARAAGLRTGLYSTPHLHTFRERIQIAGEPIGEDPFADGLERTTEAARAVEDRLPQIGSMTAYELTTTMALLVLAEQDVDIGIIEVGLGGRLDGTNIVPANVSVITNISFDHTAVLGNDLEAIAREKGGIIKPGQTVVLGPQRQEVTEVIAEIAAERGAWLIRDEADWGVSYREGLSRLVGPWGTLNSVELGLAGEHQAENAGTALAAVWAISPVLVDDLVAVRDALTGVKWPGRFEVVGDDPPIVLDGAHNVESVRRLVETIRDRFPGQKPRFILGASADKDLKGMIEELSRLDPEIVAVASRSPRAVAIESIVEFAVGAGLDVQTQDSVADGLASPDGAGLVVVTGSLFIVAEAREALGLAEPNQDEIAIFAH